MREITNELQQIVSDFGRRIGQIPEAELSARPSPAKWSKKEILGHLVDSGQNNLRRFISAQYENEPAIAYDQDFWVSSIGYQGLPGSDVLALWFLVNTQIARVLMSMDPGNYEKQCNTGKNTVALYSLQWLAEDYIRHMKHHLNQIIPGSFDIVYK